MFNKLVEVTFLVSVVKNTTRATIDVLEQDFAHFGYPHTVVTDKERWTDKERGKSVVALLPCSIHFQCVMK